ncbi:MULTISPECIES: FeoA family protein [Methanosarcina]|uniref:FeoA family protein n=7 Tax=Methanosarcina mazei TaxID=2209 RepID=A0A0F8LVK3_METMZ|nr:MULTISPECIES: ferrous iron transport protein A [Methanosarcina]AGF97926.1 Ferrous iron transport protein A [Methanosarcina mazei Tuc01]AKB41252.1 Ferrous iron transport protein A [Methanosarcina mazei WWM610]AKB61995.1 Ferrous iron transport protein A [Methanosarcina mazei SarPi]AKB65325.1 Ferrous iron transport protein A [Methanosarcina mazei S-6]AKB69517.1 Ferrous iron transport protein A [Methanosarcina mazei LYC]
MPAQMPLTMLQEGKGCRISEVRAGAELRRRLIEMGFTPSSSVRLIGCERGNLLVNVNGARYALGKGMAMKIMVEPDSFEGAEIG